MNLLNHRLTSPKHDIDKGICTSLAHDFSEQQSKQLLIGFYLHGDKKSQAQIIKKENEKKSSDVVLGKVS